MRLRDGFTPSRAKQFDLKYPKKQMFKKTDLAKFVNSYGEIQEGKKLTIGPHIVVRGNEKNYAQFINYNLPKKLQEYILKMSLPNLYCFGKQKNCMASNPITLVKCVMQLYHMLFHCLVTSLIISLI